MAMDLERSSSCGQQMAWQGQVGCYRGGKKEVAILVTPQSEDYSLLPPDFAASPFLYSMLIAVCQRAPCTCIGIFLGCCPFLSVSKSVFASRLNVATYRNIPCIWDRSNSRRPIWWCTCTVHPQMWPLDKENYLPPSILSPATTTYATYCLNSITHSLCPRSRISHLLACALRAGSRPPTPMPHSPPSSLPMSIPLYIAHHTSRACNQPPTSSGPHRIPLPTHSSPDFSLSSAANLQAHYNIHPCPVAVQAHSRHQPPPSHFSHGQTSPSPRPHSRQP